MTCKGRLNEVFGTPKHLSNCQIFLRKYVPSSAETRLRYAFAVNPVTKSSFPPEFYFAENCFITELSNTPDDPELSIAKARVAAGQTTRWHRLLGVAERYYILSGRGRVEVGDLLPQDLKPGDVVIIPAMCRQRITNTGSADLIFLAICTPRFSHAAYEDVDASNV